MTQPSTETPWQEDGVDYGRDLGTGVPADVGTPEHHVDTPRSYEGANDPMFPAQTEDAGATPVATTFATRGDTLPSSGQDLSQSSSDDSAPEGGNG